MQHSPYLNMDRDLSVLRRIVEDHEDAKMRESKTHTTIEREIRRPAENVWEPVYPTPIALAS